MFATEALEFFLQAPNFGFGRETSGVLGLLGGALLLFGRALWPGIFLGAFVANVMTIASGAPSVAIATSLLIATGNTLEAVVSENLIRRWAGGPAALQHAQGCDNPILIRIETRAGHCAGKPISKRIDEAADRWAFLWKALGMSGSDNASEAGN